MATLVSNIICITLMGTVTVAEANMAAEVTLANIL
jgi:hypothetical protein